VTAADRVDPSPKATTRTQKPTDASTPTDTPAGNPLSLPQAKRLLLINYLIVPQRTQLSLAPANSANATITCARQLRERNYHLRPPKPRERNYHLRPPKLRPPASFFRVNSANVKKKKTIFRSVKCG
jgi:hypothetical protein